MLWLPTLLWLAAAPAAVSPLQKGSVLTQAEKEEDEYQAALAKLRAMPLEPANRIVAAPASSASRFAHRLAILFPIPRRLQNTYDK